MKTRILIHGANHAEVRTTNGVYFQSYNSVVCHIDNNDKVILSYWWDYSRTTMRWLWEFLRSYGYGDLCNPKTMRKAIKAGEVVEMEETSLEII